MASEFNLDALFIRNASRGVSALTRCYYEDGWKGELVPLPATGQLQGAPAFSSSGRVYAFSTGMDEGRSRVSVRDLADQTVSEFDVEGIVGVMDFDFNGTQLALSASTASRSYSMGGHIRTGCQILVFNINACDVRTIALPPIDAVKALCFIDEGKLMVIARNWLVMGDAVYIVDLEKDEARIVKSQKSLYGVVSGAQNVFHFKTDENYDYGVIQGRFGDDEITFISDMHGLKYIWSYSCDKTTNSVIAATDPNRKGNVYGFDVIPGGEARFSTKGLYASVFGS